MKKVNIKRKLRVLFVCLGNICRSPAAEGIMRHLLEQRMLQETIEVDSAGLGHWHVGELPDVRMRRQGERHGYTFDSRARMFSIDDFDHFHIIAAMDQTNLLQLKSHIRYPSDERKIVCMADFLSHHPMFNSIPDPYYGGEQGFEMTIELLEDACEGLLDYILRTYFQREVHK